MAPPFHPAHGRQESDVGSIAGAESARPKKPAMKIRHREETTPRVLKPLMTYTYNSSVPTSCEVNMPCQDITLIVNKLLTKADVSVETVDAEVPFRKLLLASTTCVYVISGSMSVSLEYRTEPIRIYAGHTLIIEKDDSAPPCYFKASKMMSEEGGLVSDGMMPAGDASATSDANFIFIQIHELEVAPSGSASSVQAQVQGPVVRFRPLSTTDGPPSRAITRTGSIVVYDDQPLWALPQEIADKMNLDDGSGDPSQRRVQVGLHSFADSQLYEPPEWAEMSLESAVPPPIIVDELNLDDFPVGTKSTAWINMMKQGLSDWIRIPCIVARGERSTPNRCATPMVDLLPSSDPSKRASTTSDEPEELVIGITAALHGNEVNGVSCIQRLMADLDITKLRGTVVACPCINVPGYLNFKREFRLVVPGRGKEKIQGESSDGRDLNRQFPGLVDGVASQVYAHLLMEKVVNNLTFLIDLHTASFGRVNSYYVRADMNDPVTATLARLQEPQIILHNSGQDGTMRSAASQRGIKSITVEIGNPQQFQNQFIQWSYTGLLNILDHLGMYDLRDYGSMSLSPADRLTLVHQPHPAILCSKGFWTYTKTGGVLEVYPTVNSYVRKGLVVARIRNIFGNIVDEYFAPCDSMVIGRSSNPVAMAGDRIIHFGVLLRYGESLPAVAKENY